MALRSISDRHLGLFAAASIACAIALGVVVVSGWALVVAVVVCFSAAFAVIGMLLDRSGKALRTQSAIAQNMAEGVVLVRADDGAIAWTNESFDRMFGYEPGELIGRPSAAIRAEDYGEHEQGTAEITDGVLRDGAWSGEVRNVRKDGSSVWCHANVSRFEHPEFGSVYCGVLTDVSAELQARTAMVEAEERFRTAFDQAPIGMAVTSLQGRYLRVNDAMCRITGYSREQLEAIGFRSITHPDDVDAAVEAMGRLVRGEIGSFRSEKRYIGARGQAVPVELYINVVRDAEGRPLHFLAQMQDIAERKRFEGQLQYLADHDALTGLFNRRRFEEELQRELESARRYGPGGAVLALDIDHFKLVNDTFGHAVGDELIARVAAGLRERLRRTDVLARLGGDEFAIVLPRAEREEALAVAEGLLESVRRAGLTEVGPHRAHLTASIGIAAFGGPDELVGEEALVEADIAMYEAKDAGRNCAVVYERGDEHRAGIEARFTWAERIRTALAGDGFELHAQPILDLATDRVGRHELLLRMHGEDGDLIPPAAFLYVAERLDLIKEIDRWVVRRAIEQLAERQRAGDDAHFEVNLSGRSFGDPELTRMIAEELRRHGADPAGLCFEVTETAAIVNVEHAKRFAHDLREIGCEFALDDFGAGFASFYYLKHLAFDYLKIDGEFIKDLTASHVNQLVVRSVVDIARGLGKRTVAEFVEDEPTLELLRAYGVDYAQGYFVGRPRPLSELDRGSRPAPPVSLSA